MEIFRRKKAQAAAAEAVQLRAVDRQPFGVLDRYVPLRGGEIQIYRAIREAVPVVDAAIYKIVRMVGGVTATCKDRSAEAALQEFLRTVAVGRGQFGINAFLDCYVDSLLVRPGGRRDRALLGRQRHRCAAVRPGGGPGDPGGGVASGVFAVWS